MELTKLKYFYEAATRMHITKTAEALHVSQPALTQAIKSLEWELDVRLFENSGRNVVLTPAGKFLKEKLDKLLPEIDEIPQEIAALKSRKAKTIKLNILAASTFVINAIVQYRKNHPSAVIDFEQNELKRGCDISIYTDGLTGTADKNIVKKCVKEEKIYLAVPEDSAYSGLKQIELSAVKEQKFVMLSGSRLFRKICDNLCAKAGFTPKILFESDSPNAVQNVISTGAGIAFWPEYSWGKMKNDNVRLVEVSSPVCKRQIIVELNGVAARSEYAEDFYEYLLSKM